MENIYKTYSYKGLNIIHNHLISDEEHYQVSHNFILDIFKGFATLAQKYNSGKYDLIDNPYTFGERQLDSLIMPTLSNICNGYVMCEMPSQRKIHSRILENNLESQGRADYWCIYKDYTFVIELKHNFDCCQTTKTRKRNIQNWEVMTKEQLPSIKEELINFEESTKGVIRIGLHFMTSYTERKINFEQTIKNFTSQVESMLTRITRDLCLSQPSKTKPDFSGCWIIPKKNAQLENIAIPGIILIGKIYKPLKHKGATKLQIDE